MTAKNDITGDKIQTRVPSQKYKDNWDKIFGGKDDAEEQIQESQTTGQEEE